jgi:hypothetical protein
VQPGERQLCLAFNAGPADDLETGGCGGCGGVIQQRRFAYAGLAVNHQRGTAPFLSAGEQFRDVGLLPCPSIQRPWPGGGIRPGRCGIMHASHLPEALGRG